MARYNEGDRYVNPASDTVFEVVETIDTAGMPTHEAENVGVPMRDPDGERYTFFADMVRSWAKAPSTTDDLTDEEKAEIADRAREDWGRLAREFGVDEDTVREVIVG